ncbi:hypothetical protein ACJZ2D_014365 [Fusarium nematophilum]
MAQATANLLEAQAPLAPDTDDCEMVAFLNTPVNQEPAPVDQTSVASTNDDPEADNPRPAEAPENVRPHGFRAFLDGLIAVVVLFQPWAISSVLCWMPITRVPLHEAPSTVLVSIVASTIEVFTISICIIILIYSRLKHREKPPPTIGLWKWLRSAIPYVFFFLCLCPIATGLFVWFKARRRDCVDGDHSLKCRVGPRFMLAIALFRILGVNGLLWFGFMFLAISGNYFLFQDSLETIAT